VIDARIGRIGEDLVGLFRDGAPGQWSDAELLRRFAQGRGDAGAEAAFAALVERHGPMVRGACRRVLNDRHAADDAFQATFLTLARKAGRLEGIESLGGWLYRVAIRVALKARRARRDERLDGLAPAAPGPETGPAERAELRQAIDAEIARLPARYRAAVVLCHIEGLDGPSAARRLRIPLGTLQSRLHRARLRLRRGLTRRGFAPAGVAGALAAVEAPARAEVPASLARSIARLAALGGPPPAGVEYLILGFSWRTVMKTKAAWIAGLSVGITGLGGGLGLAHRGTSAGAGPPAQVIAKPAGLSVGERIRAVLDEHVRSLQKQAVGDLFASLVTKQARERSFAERRDKTIETSRKLLDLIEQDPRDPESLRAMTWHVDQYWTSGLDGPMIDQFHRSVDVLLRHYADERRIAFRVLVRPSDIPTPFDDRLIPLLAASARRRETKGLAVMALGEYLENKARMVLRVQAAEGRYHFDVPESGKTWETPLYSEAYEKVLRDSDAVALFAKAEAVFARVAAEFADVMKPMRCPDDEEFMTWVPPGRLGDLAGERLAVLRAVAIGRPAPDLTWTGADGRETRLSDLRGKVVLLSFREVGEGPFEDEPAYTAGHAARLKDRPFALVAVDSPDAPIRNRLGVGRSGAAILFDAAGRFRFQGPESRLLGSYIDALVKEAEARK
jgi:RNA polymerase sigma factor (sigma-70 family)